jgi:hypothetical protein
VVRRLIILAAAVAIAVPTAALARSGGNPPLTSDELTRYQKEVETAVAQEREAINLVYKNTHKSQSDAADKVTFSHQGLYDAKESFKGSSFTGNSPVPDLDTAYDIDSHVESELRTTMSDHYGKPFTKPFIKKIVAQLTLTIAAKKKGLALIDLITVTAPPAPGPLEGCVFVVNNGSTSTENVKIVDPGGGGFLGTVTFNGQGVNQSKPFTLDSSGTSVTPFTVGEFGSSTIGATVTGPGGQTQSLSFPFTLNGSNDVTASDCAPHQ